MNTTPDDSPIHPIIGSLCTGYGGLDMGVLAALGGGHIAWIAETDAHASALLQRRIKSAINIGDIRSVDWHSIPRVNILTAGFPCQDVSAAGKRKGIQEGNRSGLFYRIMEAVRVLRPDCVVLENVAALRWKDGGLGEVLAHLAKAGYDAFWTSIRANDIGAPHRRERVFVLATPQQCPEHKRRGSGVASSPNGSLRGRGGTFIPDSDRFRLRQDWLRSERPEDTRSANQPERYRDAVPAASTTPQRPHLTLVTDTDDVGSDEGFAPGQGLEGESGTHRSRHRTAAYSAGGSQSQKSPIDRATTFRPRAGAGHRNHPRSDADRTDQLAGNAALMDWGIYEAAIQRWESLLGRPAPHPAEPGRAGRPRLSPLFVEWMMGLPEAWVTGDDLALPRSAQLQALGNGVVPQQAAVAVLELLHQQERLRTDVPSKAAS